MYGDLPEPTSIRLLTVLPTAATDSDRLECHLQVHQSIRDAPPYEAISYAWGSNVRDRPLVCNGADMKITQSLDVALRRLRGLGPRVLWIDQICIDQSNVQERSKQVQMMRDIFSAAQRVILWLGPDPDGKAKAAAVLLEKLMYLFLDSGGQNIDLGLPRFPGDDKLAELGLPSSASTEWKDLESMLCLPYFERIWVIQEVVVANARTILWGEAEISWDCFWMGCGWAYMNRLYLSDQTGLGNRTRPSLSVPQISTLLSFQRRRPWIDLIRETPDHKATDPRDYFFALVGIAEQKVGPLLADYSKPTAEVYAYATTHIITESKELRILSLGGWRDGGRRYGEPCWTPKLEAFCSKDPMDLYLFEFTASRALEVELEPAAHWTMLNLKGLKLGSVEAVGPVLRSLSSEIQLAGLSHYSPNDAEHSYEQSVLQSFAVLNDNGAKISARYGLQSSHTLMFAATLGLGSKMGRDGFPTSASDSELFRGLLNILWSRFLKQLIEIQGGGGEIACPRDAMELVESAIDVFASEDLPQRLNDSFSEKFRDWMLPIVEELHKGDSAVLSRAVRCGNFCLDLFDFANAERASWMNKDVGGINRRLFVTNDGSFGNGPGWLEPDDVLAILFGGRSVYALRPTGACNEYLFMGECYVYGSMNGEAIDKYDKGEIQAQWFQLK